MNPQPLPGPPGDYGQLTARFPSVGKEQLPRWVFRVHRQEREPEYFSTGDGRWDPPEGGPPTFGACYTGLDQLTAFIEAFGDLPLLTTSVIDSRAMAVLQVPALHRVADMTDPSILGDWGLDQRISVGDDYRTCQQWAQALRLAGFSGVRYGVRHDPAGSELRSFAFFGDPGYQPTQIQLLDDLPIQADVVDEAVARFGLKIWPDSPLLGNEPN